MNHEDYMQEALKEAEIALKEGNWPIGCVIELGGNIISRGHNKSYSEKSRIAHAEIEALQRVQKNLWENKKQATLYTTYEPCPMCFGAIVLSRIKRVVCGVNLDNSGASYLKEHLPELFRRDNFNVEVISGFLARECAEVFMKSEHAQKLKNKGLLNLI